MTSETTLLQRGSRVHCILYGGQDGTICAIRGEQSPETIRHLPTIGVCTGGNASFDVVFDDGTISRGIPEAIVRGVQWRLLDGTDSEEMIAARLEHARQVQDERAEMARQTAAAKAAEEAALPAKYPFPTVYPRDGSISGHAQGAKNVRKHLAHAFPGIKFSVRSKSFSGGDSIDVGWENGPTAQEVDAILDLYEDSTFDGMQDLSIPKDSPFPEVFGGAMFVHGSRSFPDTTEELVSRSICASYGVPYAGRYTVLDGESRPVSDRVYRLLSGTSLPAGATVTGYICDDKGERITFAQA